MQPISEQLNIELTTSPTPDALQFIGNGLQQYNLAFVPTDGDLPFAVLLRDEEGHLYGGLVAKAGRGWLKIGSLWVEEALQGQGYGRQLVALAEAEGVRRSCHSAYLDTFSFQAPDFYEKCGYEIFGTLEAFPEPHKRFFMRKSLNQSGCDNGKQTETRKL